MLKSRPLLMFKSPTINRNFCSCMHVFVKRLSAEVKYTEHMHFPRECKLSEWHGSTFKMEEPPCYNLCMLRINHDVHLSRRQDPRINRILSRTAKKTRSSLITPHDHMSTCIRAINAGAKSDVSVCVQRCYWPWDNLGSKQKLQTRETSCHSYTTRSE